ncbi:MAG TPA: cation diffusion facilitator family transporter [Candidatus Udaeobacter sp.]|jgi:cobalt-zinc-cadmium efflux system protein|nr:cation diffusion facilitator family transporter [Candidatus Udaeobacter sp.]
MAPDQNHHGHTHAPKDFGAAFAIGTTLNLAYVVAQVVFGILAHSLALLADAGHNFSDVLGLLLAWGATYLAKTRPTPRRTYGLGRSSILAALANAILLLIAVGGITWEAIRRFNNPGEVAGKTVIIVAAIGVFINGATALLFFSGRKADLNIKGAFLHMVADAAVSVGVVLAGLAIMITGWNWLDPVASLTINAVIVWGTWGLLRDSVAMMLDLVPASVDAKAVRSFLEQQNGVTAVHDLHIWPLSTTRTALTVHLEMPNNRGGDAFLHDLCQCLHEQFGIEHSTIQIEQDAKVCSLAPDRAL